MLPGFRILFAAVVLSFSVLIFGLGAAALLRSAHEEFVGIPSWRAAQQPLMPAMDAGRPSLALLRVEPAPAAKLEAEKPDDIKTVSIDTQAMDKTVTAEKPAIENVSKPRVRRAKRARNIRNARTIRHWSARTQQIVQPQQSVTSSNSPFTGFDAAGTTASGGAGRNRRAAGNTPF